MAVPRLTPRFEEAVSGPALPEPERNLGGFFRERGERRAGRPAVQFRSGSGRWEQLTWAQIDQRRRAGAAGLVAAGVQRGDRVAFVSENRVEMLLAEMAVASIGDRKSVV